MAKKSKDVVPRPKRKAANPARPVTFTITNLAEIDPVELERFLQGLVRYLARGTVLSHNQSQAEADAQVLPEEKP